MRAHETLERAGRHGGFPPHGFASGLLAACPSDGSHDFYLSMMLDVVLLQCLLGGFGSVFPQCGLMVFPGAVIVSR